MADQITMVMPVTVGEFARLGDHPWRADPDEGAQVRLSLALRSVAHFVEPDSVAALLLVCPDEERDEVRSLATAVATLPVEVLCESELCPGLFEQQATERAGGWYVQQILKLAAAERVKTPFYLTLDSDIVAVRPFSAGELVRDGQALVGVEIAANYEALYTPEFVSRETEVKQGRFAVAGQLLGITRPARYVGRSYGETPTLYHTESMQQMTDRLSAQHERPWFATLAETTGWTEHALYFTYAEATGALERHHREDGPNAVLHLAGSVWHRSAHYRQERRYDERHFSALATGDEGYFVAIQSWLPVDDWLPSTGCRTVDEFYAQLERTLGVA